MHEHGGRLLRRMPACLAVEKRRQRTESIRTASMVDAVAWLRSNDPSGAGLPISSGGSAAIPALFASLRDLERG